MLKLIANALKNASEKNKREAEANANKARQQHYVNQMNNR